MYISAYFITQLHYNKIIILFFLVHFFPPINLSSFTVAAQPNICFLLVWSPLQSAPSCLFFPFFFLFFFLWRPEYHCCLLYFPPLQDFPFRSPPSASYPVCDVGDNVARFLASPLRILGGRTRANTNTNRLLSCRQWGKCRQMSGSCWKLLSGRSFCIYFRGEIIDDWRPAHNAF